MVDKLENIGFYTLCDQRVIDVSETSPMWRCELLLTDRCNFKCPYCRGVRKECRGDLPVDDALKIIKYWTNEGLKNIRFSGGEPTLYNELNTLVRFSALNGVERIAISTNGSAVQEVYDTLIGDGVNDFSISLDACCSSYSDKMAGVQGYFQRVVDNIRYLSSKTYVTVGVVFTDETAESVIDIIRFSCEMGVSDIRIISAAQENEAYFKFRESLYSISQDVLDNNPILAYRITNIKNNIPVRGLKNNDSRRCGLMYDDSIIAGNYHFPCIIHFREGGDPIGKVGPNMRQERIEWANNHDTHLDPICKANCLDVCVAYNNKFKQVKNENKIGVCV